MAEAEISISCDGSSLGNPGPGGWCWFVDDSCWSAGGEGATTNNRMELRAVIEALDFAQRTWPGVPLELRCDSRYVIDALTKWVHGWRRKGWRTSSGTPVANRELVEAAVALVESSTVRFTWVRGHDGDWHNERADEHARGAAESVRDDRVVDTGPLSA